MPGSGSAQGANVEGRPTRDSRPREVLIIAITTLVVVAGVWGVNAARAGGDPSPSASHSASAQPQTATSADPSGDAPKVGALAPDFSTFSTAGDEVVLADLRGKPVWLIFGATWCSNCRAEAPDVQAVYEQYRDKVSVVGIYVGESISTVEDYAGRAGMTFPQVADMYNDIAAQYRIMGEPTHVFIDADGKISAIVMGALSPDAAKEHLDPLLR